jgi:arginyl-tRNA synthetase
MDLIHLLKSKIEAAVKSSFDYDLSPSQLVINPTKKEFEGEYTFVVFPLVKALRQKPQEIAEAIGKAITQDDEDVIGYNVIQGFLNLSLSNELWIKT